MAYTDADIAQLDSQNGDSSPVKSTYTDADIATMDNGSGDQPKPGFMETTGKTIGRIYGDAANDLKDNVTGAAHALQLNNLPETAGKVYKAMGNTAEGIKKAVTNPVETFTAENAGKTINNIKDTLMHKPVTSMINASMVMGGGGALLKGLGEANDLGTVAKVGQGMTDVANAPFQAAGKAVESGVGAVKSGAENIGKAIPENLKKSSYGLMNSIVRQLPKEVRYGNNAGRGAVNEGITGSSAEDIANKATNKIKEIGSQGDNLASSVNTTDDYSKAVKVIDDKISELQKGSPRTNKSTIQRLEDSKRDLLGIKEDADGNIINSGTDLSNMTPKEALDFKRRYDNVTQWKGTGSDDTVVNSTLQNSRRIIKDQLNDNVPGMKEWNQRYGDLSNLQSAAKRQAAYDASGSLNLGKIAQQAIRGGGVGGAIWAGIHGDIDTAGKLLGAVGMEEVINSPLVKSNLAQWLNNISNVDKAKIFQAAPWIKNNLSRIMQGNENNKPVNYYNGVNKETSGLNAPGGLPDKSIKMGPTTRSGVDRPYENVGLPSPDKAGNSTIYQGTTYTPVEKVIIDSKPTTDFGRQIQDQIKKKYEIPLHPAEDVKAGLNKVYPPVEKGNPNIHMADIADFNNMRDWESYQQKGGKIVSGGKQGGLSREVSSSSSGHSKTIQSIGGPKKAFDIMDKAANGEKMTVGEKMSLKRMLADYKKNIKPGIEGKGPLPMFDNSSEWTD